MTNDSVLPASVYKQYYKREWITPKIMANLICDNNPDTSLLSRDTKYKTTLQRIKDALKRGDLTSKDGKCLNNSEIEAQALFSWAINKYPDFQKNLPTGMIINSGGGQMELPAMTGQSFALDLPTDYQGLRQAYIQLYLENMELKDKLSIIEHEKRKKRKGGIASGGKPKYFD